LKNQLLNDESLFLKAGDIKVGEKIGSGEYGQGK